MTLVQSVIEEIQIESPWAKIRGDREICRNLIFMVWLWVFSSFGYFLIGFQLSSVPGDLWVTNYVSDGAEIVANILSVFVLGCIGLKLSYSFSLILAIIGGMLIIILNPQGAGLSLILVLIAKFSVAFCYNLAYLGNPILFEPTILATTIGVCNGLSKLGNVFSQPVAEADPATIGKWAFVILMVATLLCAVSITVPKGKNVEPRKSTYISVAKQSMIAGHSPISRKRTLSNNRSIRGKSPNSQRKIKK